MIRCSSVARGAFAETDGIAEPGPAPRFSRTPGAIRYSPRDPKQDTSEALRAWDIAQGRIDALMAAGVLPPQ